MICAANGPAIGFERGATYATEAVAANVVKRSERIK
jgi:hypothetical protein